MTCFFAKKYSYNKSKRSGFGKIYGEKHYFLHRTLSYFFIKRARKIRNKSLNCAHMCLTITKITINSAQNLAVGKHFMLFLLLLFSIGRYGADF